MTRRRLPAVCVLLAAFLGAAPWAAAQTQLPTEIVSATDLTPDQLKQLDAFVDELLPKLDGTDEMLRARNRLLEPLRASARPSVRFRQELSARLLKSTKAKTLGQLASTNPEKVAYNAVRLAGELATPESTDILIKALGDRRESVRFMASSGIGRCFDAIRDSSPAMASSDALKLVGPLGQVIAAEEKPGVVRSAVKSLASGMLVKRPGYETLRPAAFAALSRQMGARISKAGGDPKPCMESILASIAITGDALKALNDPSLRLDEAGNKAAGALSAEVLSFVMRHLGDFKDAGPQRAQVQELVAGAEVCAVQVLSVLGRAADSKGLADEFKKGTPEGDKAFFQKSLELLTKMQEAGIEVTKVDGGR